MEKKGILKHFATIGIGTILNMAFGFLATILITRMVSPGYYGELSIFKMYGSLAGSILLLGLDQALVRFYYNSDAREYKSTLLRFCVRWSLIVTAIIACIVIVIASTGVADTGYSPVCWIALAIYTAGIIYSRFSTTVLRLEYKTKEYSWCNVSQQIVYIVLAIVLLKIYDSNEAAVLIVATILGQYSVAFFSRIAGKLYWVRSKCDLTTHSVTKRELVQYAWPFIITTSVATLFQSIDKISLNYFCDYNEVGVYSSALVLMNVFAILQSTFNTLWTPLSVEHYSKAPEDHAFYKKAQEIITVLMFAFGLTVILCKDVFAIILGRDYREAAYLIPFLAFHPIMYTISEVTVGGLVFKKKSKIQVIVSVVPCAVNFIGNTILVPLYGGRGAAISTGASYILFFAMRTILSNKYYYVDYSIKRFSFLTVLSVLYATYATFYAANIMLFCFYVFVVIVMLVLYKNTVRKMVNYGISFVKKRGRWGGLRE